MADLIHPIVAEANAYKRQLQLLQDAVRKHRDSWLNGDDKCWKDNEELYKLLPEGFEPPERDELCELANCQKYIRSCHHPDVSYTSPQLWIDMQESVIRRQDEELADVYQKLQVSRGVNIAMLTCLIFILVCQVIMHL